MRWLSPLQAPPVLTPQPARHLEPIKNDNKNTNKNTIKTKKTGKKKINIADIDGPIVGSFVHVSGVSSDGSGGMTMVDNSHLIDDPAIRLMLSRAGITPESLGANDEERKENVEQVKKFMKENDLYDEYDRKQRRNTTKRQKGSREVGGRTRPPPPPASPNLSTISEAAASHHSPKVTEFFITDLFSSTRTIKENYYCNKC